MAAVQMWDWRSIPCPVCASTERRRLGRGGGDAHRFNLGVSTTIVRCKRCHLLYPDPMPFSTRALYVSPDNYFRAHEHGANVEAYRRIINRAEAMLGCRGRLIDVGGDTGVALLAAQTLGWSAVGIEPSEEFADRARSMGVDMRTGTLQEAQFPAASFDLALLGCVLAHVQQPMPILREIRRVTRAGGVLYVDTNNEAGLYFKVGALAQRLRGRDWVINLSPTFEPYHVLGFTPRSIRRALDATGFSVQTLEAWPGETHANEAARLIDRFGALLGTGSLMDVWARAR